MSDVTMTLPGRVLPLVDEVNRPFFEGAATGVLRLQQCVDTGRFQHYPRALSAYTGGAVQWVEASGKGRVYSFTVIRQNQAAPAFHAQTPYIVALIDLDEGARVMGNIIASPDADVRIGAPVEVAFHCIDPDAGIHLPFWTLAEAGGS
jgi:uncharacterized OB-fold protein